MSMTTTHSVSPRVSYEQSHEDVLGTRDVVLGVLASSVSDLETLRIAISNRVYSLTHTGPDVDDVLRGHQLAEDDPAVIAMQELLEGTKALEKLAIKAMQKRMKKHVLYEWVSKNKGVGEKTAARLLSALGDPYIRDMYVGEGDELRHVLEPRTVSELWSYAGYGVVNGAAPKRTKGQKVNWNPEIRMRVWLIAETSIRSNGDYKPVYDETKASAMASPHLQDCARCKAKAGEPLSKGHAHARAMRRVSKEILRDLWTLSKEWHESNDR